MAVVSFLRKYAQVGVNPLSEPQKTKSAQEKYGYITKTCLYNFDPLKPHF